MLFRSELLNREVYLIFTFFYSNSRRFVWYEKIWVEERILTEHKKKFSDNSLGKDQERLKFGVKDIKMLFGIWGTEQGYLASKAKHPEYKWIKPPTQPTAGPIVIIGRTASLPTAACPEPNLPNAPAIVAPNV